jgi:hypothetical protein
LGIAAIQQFAGDHRGFDSLSNANVVGDEYSHRFELERHDERHKLIRTWPNGEASEAPERSRAVAEPQAGGIAQELSSNEVPGLFWLRRQKLGVFEGLAFYESVDTADFRLTAA